MNPLEIHTSQIAELCDRHKVRSMYAFGSVLTEEFDARSDIDLIVEFQPLDILDYADNYFDLKFALQDLLERPVDLLEAKAIKNPYFRDSIIQKRQLIYG